MPVTYVPTCRIGKKTLFAVPASLRQQMVYHQIPDESTAHATSKRRGHPLASHGNPQFRDSSELVFFRLDDICLPGRLSLRVKERADSRISFALPVLPFILWLETRLIRPIFPFRSLGRRTISVMYLGYTPRHSIQRLIPLLLILAPCLQVRVIIIPSGQLQLSFPNFFLNDWRLGFFCLDTQWLERTRNSEHSKWMYSVDRYWSCSTVCSYTYNLIHFIQVRFARRLVSLLSMRLLSPFPCRPSKSKIPTLPNRFLSFFLFFFGAQHCREKGTKYPDPCGRP